ncbi:response regulator [Jannaschia seosinensis]|uniref:Response regulator n=1 Tax=Jannaschia seosinensis TaxID=313367 RepID=A0A0M7B9N2_9RHOB|nr:response regulator [Jannaschia seosinensis]CUH26576.1 response regulator [Jannaschia seosinensis]
MRAVEPLCVLVIEDETLIALEIEDMLEELGHSVIGPVATVTQALDLIEKLSLRPDAALVDANLGGQSARPVVDALRVTGIPLVLASGYEVAELRRLGFTDPIMRKPYTAHDVNDALEALKNASYP